MDTTTRTGTRPARTVGLVATVIVTVLGVVAGVLALGGSTASALPYKVDHINLSPAHNSCHPGQALPCTPTAGSGDSGEFTVSQSEVADGVWAFDSVETTSIDDDHLWISVIFGGKCKLGSRLHGSGVGVTWNESTSVSQAPQEVSPGDAPWFQSIPVNQDHITHTDRIVDMHVPLDEIWRPANDPTGASTLYGFPTLESVFARGEAEIADRVANGMSEGAARGQGFTVDTWIAVRGALTCLSTVGNNYSTGNVSYWVPVQITFEGNADPAGLELDDPTPPEPVDGGGLTVGAQVTQAFLTVGLDPTDSCRLNLTGVIVTNAATEVEYRFVNELGVKSQIFTVEVDHTFTAHLDHHVDLPVVDGDRGDDGGDLVANPGHHDGVIDGYAVGESDNVQGTYMIEVITPHAYESNVDGYNVEPCVEPVGGFTRS